MSECKWTRELCAELRKFNALAVTYPQGRTSHAGFPDRIIVHRSFGAVFVEFKDVDTPYSAKQREVLEQIRDRAPGTAFLCRRVSATEACLALPDESQPVVVSLRTRRGAGELLRCIAELQATDRGAVRTAGIDN